MTLSRSLVVIAAACALAAGCRRNDAAIRVNIHVANNVKATCLRLVALSRTGSEHISETFIRGTRTDFVGAVFRKDDLEGGIGIRVRGYVSEAGCAEPLVLNEESEVVPARFVDEGPTPEVSIDLPPLSADKDGDLDGYRPQFLGGPDCDDGDPLTHPNAVERCSDTKDNDCNGATDCADSACNGQTCSDRCTTGGTCSSSMGFCTGGTRTACNTPPPGSCWQVPGTCDPRTGCSYMPTSAGIACPGPGGICAKDECNGTGSCVHSLQDAGTPCAPDNACAAGYQCSAAGACGSTMTTMCPLPPSECFASAGCAVDAGCSFTVDAGAPCGDGGTCLTDGGCRPAGPAFTYAPSNFNPTAFSPGGLQVTVDCPVTYDSTGAANPGRWCSTSGPMLTATRITQDGGVEAVLLAMEQLTITQDGGLRLIGSLPVIFAVYGDATINGYINASATGTDAGAGGSWAGCLTGEGKDGGNGVTLAATAGGGGGGYGGDGARGGARSGGVAGEQGFADGGRELVPLRGGCAGGPGGTWDGGPAAPSGAGGGAVQISAAGSLTVSGDIWAAGGGGVGGPLPSGGDGGSGGGGGGSGGAILFEARVLNLLSSASLTANGGGGGAGSALADAGNPGDDGYPASADGGAGGGAWTSAGNGGAGGGRSSAAVAGASGSSGNPGASGGGGGGVGRIRLNAAAGCSYSPSAVVSPLASSKQPDGGVCAP